MGTTVDNQSVRARMTAWTSSGIRSVWWEAQLLPQSTSPSQFLYGPCHRDETDISLSSPGCCVVGGWVRGERERERERVSAGKWVSAQ